VSQETRVVYISIPREDASNFARELVDMRLAACVNIIPKMESFYRWEGKTLADSEALLIVKTSLARMTELQAHVIEHHPYEIPELIAMPITDGLAEYLNWVVKETE